MRGLTLVDLCDSLLASLEASVLLGGSKEFFQVVGTRRTEPNSAGRGQNPKWNQFNDTGTPVRSGSIAHPMNTRGNGAIPTSTMDFM